MDLLSSGNYFPWTALELVRWTLRGPYMIAIDFTTDFSPDPIAQRNTSKDELLSEMEAHKVTLALATSRRGLKNQVNGEAVAETLAETIDNDRLLPVGTLDPRRYVGWRDDLQRCVEGGCVAIRFAPGAQRWSPDTLLFEQMVEAIGPHQLPIVVDCDQAGSEAEAWIHHIAEISTRHQVRVVLNEVAYQYMGEMITVMHRYSTVHAGIRRLSLAGSLELAVTEGLIDRFLFASNAPRYSVRGLLYQVLGADLSNTEKQAVLADNALRLLGLDREQLPSSAREINADLELPSRPIVDVHAHVSGFFLPQPIDGIERTTVPEMSAKCNIEVTIVSSYHAIDYDMAAGNAQTAEFLDQYPSLRGYVVCDARDLPGSVRQMEQHFADPRFVGVKLYCPFGGPMSDLGMQELLNEVSRFGRPVKIHMDASPYAGLRKAAERLPRLIFIKAHGDDLEGARQVADLPNVYFEFCSSGLSAGRIRRSTDALGADRILFGTDQQIFAPWYQLGIYMDAIRDSAEAELVYRTNPRRIFDLRIE